MKVLHRFKSGNQRIQVAESGPQILALLWEGENLENIRQLDPEDMGVKVVSEFFYGPDDERLPEDVKDLPVGKREDFVEEFNFWSSYYWKEDDPGYDENKTRAENRVRYGLEKAYDFISPSTEEEAVEKAGTPKGLLGTLEWVEHEGQKVAHLSEVSHSPFAITVGEAVTITPNSDGSFDHPITILEGGWSLNDRYYTERAVESIARFAEQGRVSFFNHGETFNRDPRDWGAMVTEANAEGMTARGSLHVFANNEGSWMQERIEKASDLFGVSIDAFARVEEGEKDGRKGLIVTEIVALNSVDIVMFPGAKGGFDATTESRNSLGESVMDLATLKEKHPDLVTLVANEIKESLAAEHTAAIAVVQSDLDAANARNEAATQEKAELQAKVDEFEAKEAERKFKKELKTLIESELPEPARRPNDKGEIPFMTICENLGPEHLDTTITRLIAERKRSFGSGAITDESERTIEEVENVIKTDEIDVLENVWNGKAAATA